MARNAATAQRLLAVQLVANCLATASSIATPYGLLPKVAVLPNMLGLRSRRLQPSVLV